MGRKEYENQTVLEGFIKDFYRTGDRQIMPKISETYRGLLNHSDYTIPAGIDVSLKECMDKYSFARKEFEEVIGEKQLDNKRKSRIHLIRSAKGGREDTKNALKFNQQGYVDSSKKSPGYTLGRARELMDYSVKRGDVHGAIKAHELYDQIGKGDSPNALKGVMEAYSIAKAKGPIEAGLEQMVEEVKRDHQKVRSREFSAVASILGFVGGAFFLSSNMTGNVIGLSSGSSNIIGAVLLVIGLVACFSWVKSKKNSKVVKKVSKKKSKN